LTGIACPPSPKDDPSKKDNAKPDDKKPTDYQPDQLKTRVAAALDEVRGRDLLTTHAFWTVFHGILGMGIENTTLYNPETKKRVNAIDYICDGGEIRGLQFLPTKDGLDVVDTRTRPDLQFVAQGHQDQFIAEMAQWGMAKTRKFKVGGQTYTFEDFLKHSKARASVTKEQELSWAIIVIAQYDGTEYAWVNGLGEKLHLRDVVRYEVNASITEAACGGTHRLFGLTWAYHLHLRNGGQTDGVWKDVETKIAEYKQRAREMQNPDGAFSTAYFKAKENQPNAELRIGTTGHIVEWLALAMTDAELKAPWMQKAVHALAMQILELRNDPIDGGALYHAAHGLHIYHERVWGTPAVYLPLLPKK
jgi:hypothetical protein